MKLSARSRYAARILLELARHDSGKPISAATLSQYTGVSVQFVEQILKPLKQKGLTSSVRGATGGHKLARSPEQITLGEVVRLMEGGIMLSVCCGEKANDCPRKEGCLTRIAWMQVSGKLEEELDRITLATLLHGDQICSEWQETTAQKNSAKTVQTGKLFKPAPARPTKASKPAAWVSRPTQGRKVKGLRRA